MSHKRQHSTDLHKYFPTTKSPKTSASSKSHIRHISTSIIGRTTALPTNRTTFVRNISYRSTIPKGLKANKNTRRYLRIPNNRKYGIGSMATTTTGAGNLGGVETLVPKIDHSKRFYETRLVEITRKRNGTGALVRSPISISMPSENTWPTWTANISMLPRTAYDEWYESNMGYRHKGIIDLHKTTTIMITQTTSKQPWKCRMIVWTHGDGKPYNRVQDANGSMDSDMEYELLNTPGTLKEKEGERCAEISWTNHYVEVSNEDQPMASINRIDNLLERPLNTKYASTPFYWGTSQEVGILYDSTHIIPGMNIFTSFA